MISGESQTMQSHDPWGCQMWGSWGKGDLKNSTVMTLRKQARVRGP
jgi:hypothetical protein